MSDWQKKTVEDEMFMRLKVQRQQELRVKNKCGNVNLEEFAEIVTKC